MTQIVELTSQNVKRIRAVHIVPDSPLLVLGGDNEQGKSSVLDSILYAIAGTSTLPPLPIRDGGDSAEVVLKLDNGWTIKRSFTPTASYLKITAADGAVYPSPQNLLDDLHGKTAFDPLAFLRLDPKKQVETLRKLVGLDFTAQDAQRKALYDKRTTVNARVTEMRGQVAGLPEHKDAPAAEVSSAAILAEIEKAQTHNAEQTRLSAAVTSAQSACTQSAEAIARSNASIAALEKQLTAARAQLAKDVKADEVATAALGVANKALLSFNPIDTTALKTQLASCEATNAKVRANAARAKAIAEGIAKKAEADALTAQIDALDQAKKDALAAVEFPVEDLSFADDMITYQNLPFSQASSAAQQRVSVAIGAALNPKLRVMLIRDGSLLDAKNLAALRETATELGLQIWLERVSKGEECSVIIEDGSVVGAPPVTPIASEARPTKGKRAAKSTASSLPAATSAPGPLEDDPFTPTTTVPEAEAPAGAAF